MKKTEGTRRGGGPLREQEAKELRRLRFDAARLFWLTTIVYRIGIFFLFFFISSLSF